VTTVFALVPPVLFTLASAGHYSGVCTAANGRQIPLVPLAKTICTAYSLGLITAWYGANPGYFWFLTR